MTNKLESAAAALQKLQQQVKVHDEAKRAFESSKASLAKAYEEFLADARGIGSELDVDPKEDANVDLSGVIYNQAEPEKGEEGSVADTSDSNEVDEAPVSDSDDPAQDSEVVDPEADEKPAEAPTKATKKPRARRTKAAPPEIENQEEIASAVEAEAGEDHNNVEPDPAVEDAAQEATNDEIESALQLTFDGPEETEEDKKISFQDIPF